MRRLPVYPAVLVNSKLDYSIFHRTKRICLQYNMDKMGCKISALSMTESGSVIQSTLILKGTASLPTIKFPQERMKVPSSSLGFL